MRSNRLQINISEPCSERWKEMAPTSGGKYCHHCEKEVIDFTKLSTKELKDWFSRSNGRVCGRLLPDQLTAINNQLSPKIKFETTSIKILVAACFTLIANLKTSAASVAKQSYPTALHENIIEKKAVNESSIEADSLITLTGLVKSKNDGLPIFGANVKLKQYPIAVSTDQNGRFRIRVKPDEGKKLILIVSSIGYLQIEQEISLFKTAINVVMEEDKFLMGEVIVVNKRYENLYFNLFQRIKRLFR